MRIAIASLLFALLATAPLLASENYSPSVADLSASVQLASAQNALEQLSGELEPSQRQTMYGLAITSLTALYQLHGCAWALAPLTNLYAQPDCPELFYGYSRDGRVALRVERLLLQNPAFANHRVYLCQLQSNSALSFTEPLQPSVVFHQPSGVLHAELLDATHPLWPNLDKLAHTFVPPPLLHSGAASAFKQLYALPSTGEVELSKVTFNWSDYSFEINVPGGS